MKKLFAILFVALVSLSAVAAENIASVDLKIRVVKGGDLIFSTAQRVDTDGKAVPVATMRETSYRASASRNASGEIEALPGVVKTGVSVTLTPEVQLDGQIKTRIKLSISNLVEMKTVVTADGLEIQVPRIEESTLDQTVTQEQGKASTLNMDDYKIELTATKV